MIARCLIPFLLLLTACTKPPEPAAASADFDPLAAALASKGRIKNREAVIPAQCYTKTGGVSNPCWTCHTAKNGKNFMDDRKLQEEYAFSEQGKTNHWENLFKDRSAQSAQISDAQVLAYVRQDNYTPLLEKLKPRRDYLGWKPDLDLRQGFDEDGLARDGSWWRAFRYKPFLGTFWPTNGSTDDVMIRLPRAFYTDTRDRESRAIYKINLAILEAALTVPDSVPDQGIVRRVDPVDETLAGLDLNADGRIAGQADVIRALPAHYAGAAASEPVTRHLYPKGTEFLHTVRYLDPDAPGLMSARMKEVRYSVKVQWLNDDALAQAYADEAAEKAAGALPGFPGSPMTGLLSPFGWQLQGFIEDAQGRLRLQTHEEHQFCMGCHSTIGVTVDQTFGFPRKVPGAAGWGHQSLAGIADVPQAGQSEGEILSYFRRVGGGDEFRANEEILGRFFPGGKLNETAVKRAAPSGDQDISWLITPSRERALLLDKAYMALVQEQSFERGRDTLIKPAQNVHRKIENGDTGLKKNKAIYGDGRLWLEWP